MISSAIRELLELTEIPDDIFLAGSLPTPEVLPGLREQVLHTTRPEGARHRGGHHAPRLRPGTPCPPLTRR
jgi:hypothetical protein